MDDNGNVWLLVTGIPKYDTYPRPRSVGAAPFLDF